MSDEQQSDRYRLPAELSEFESQLSKVAPTRPSVDRDELMFAAGYAAAEAKLVLQNTSLNHSAPRLSTLAMAMATAASLLLSAVLFWQNRGPSIAQPDFEPPTNAVEALVTDEKRPTSTYVTTPTNWTRAPWTTTGYLGVRYMALARGIDGALTTDIQSVNGSKNSHDGYQLKKPATAGELLDELLPAATRHRLTRS